MLQDVVVLVTIYNPDVTTIPTLYQVPAPQMPMQETTDFNHVTSLPTSIQGESGPRYFNALDEPPSSVSAVTNSTDANVGLSAYAAHLAGPTDLSFCEGPNRSQSIHGQTDTYVNHVYPRQPVATSSAFRGVQSHLSNSHFNYHSQCHDLDNSVRPEYVQYIRHVRLEPGRASHYKWKFQDSRVQGRRRTNSHNNYVDIDRIKQGTDVRTTVSIAERTSVMVSHVTLGYVAQYSEQG